MACNHIEVLDLVHEGNWDEAHQIVQSYTDTRSCLIHGYLHRIEGDLNNANYWYNQANEKMPDNNLEEELKRLYELMAS